MKDINKNNKVYYISLIVVFSITAWGIISPSSFENAANGLFNFLVNNFGWLYLISMFIFVLFSVFLACSRYGKIRLGPDDSRPEYSNLSWFGIFLVQVWELVLYFGVLQSHYFII